MDVDRSAGYLPCLTRPTLRRTRGTRASRPLLQLASGPRPPGMADPHEYEHVVVPDARRVVRERLSAAQHAPSRSSTPPGSRSGVSPKAQSGPRVPQLEGTRG